MNKQLPKWATVGIGVASIVGAGVLLFVGLTLATGKVTYNSK